MTRLERRISERNKADFRHFRWVENQAGERVGVVNAPRLGSQRTATPTAQGFSAFLLFCRSGTTFEDKESI